MDKSVEDKRAELAELCTRHSVKRLELFGSAATGAFNPHTSDLDFLVQFEAMPPPAHADHYFALLEALESLFGRHVDLVEAGAVHNPYFLRAIDRTRVVLYAA